VAACAKGPANPAATPSHAGLWAYDVRAAGQRADDLVVEADFCAGSGDDLGVDDSASPFVRDVAYASADRWVPAPAHGTTWTVPCRRGGCHVRYHFALREAAVALDNPEVAGAFGDAIVAPPSTWLLRSQPIDGRYRLHVVVDPPMRFAAGIRPAIDGTPNTFEAPIDTLDDSSFAIAGAFDRRTIRVGNAQVDVAIAPHGLGLSDADVAAWVGTAVDGIAAYYHGLRVARALVIVAAGSPGAPTRGETLGAGGPAVLVRAADGMTAQAVRSDWVMTHELLHVTLPSLSRDHEWLSEGIATYVEPIVRARAGLVTPEAFWRDLVEGLPQGLPRPGDEGLERTHTWGRTYWGGALFCLMADIALREKTSGARSLDDALRGIVATGADVEVHWTIDQFLDAADRTTETRVLHDLYRDMALAAGAVDLPALWRRLGVHVEDGQVTFDESAPLAVVRRAITAASSLPVGPP
jgi:hypothetical protein